MFKYSVMADSKTMQAIHKTDDLDAALALFISTYQSGAFDHVNVIDNKTGEVYAYFNADPRDLWQSDEITLHMLKVITLTTSDDLFQ